METTTTVIIKQPGKSTDAQRRKKQALRFARIIAVSRLLIVSNDVSVNTAEQIAKRLGVSSRTVYRDIVTVREANQILGGLSEEYRVCPACGHENWINKCHACHKPFNGQADNEVPEQ